MKKYFNLKLAALALFIGITTTSCDKDKDKEEAAPAGNTEYNGQKYMINNGYYASLGGVDFIEDEKQEPTHFTNVIVLTDATVPMDLSEDEDKPFDGKIIMMGALFSANGNEFKPGTFEFFDENTATEMTYEQFKALSFFPEFEVLIDTNGNNKLDDGDVEEMVKGGTITVTGTFPNVKTAYDLTLHNGKKISGSFEGKFNQFMLNNAERNAFLHSKVVL